MISTKILKLVNNTIFEKKEGDAFSSNELIQYLKKLQVSEIILTGLIAEGCIYKTVLGGIFNHFDMNIIPDAVGAKLTKVKKKHSKN